MLGEGGNFNTLYESKGNNLSTNTRKELKVTGAQKWGTEGYKEEKTSQSEKPKVLNTTSVSNTNAGIIQSGNTNKTFPYVEFQEIGVVEIIIVLYSSYVKKQEEKYDPNSREKKKLMSELFGGLTIDSTWNTSSSNNNNNNLFESKNNSNRITVEVCSVE